eukprot:3191210-Prymnesium_polylepis.1
MCYPASGDLKHTRDHQFWVNSSFLAPDGLIATLWEKSRWEIAGDGKQIDMRSTDAESDQLSPLS